MRFSIRPEALGEATGAIEQYRALSDSLGARFAEQLNATIDLIRRNARLFAIVSGASSRVDVR